MNSQKYKVKIWKNEDKKPDDGPYREIDATKEEEAIRKALGEESISGKFYAEVHLDIDGEDHCWVYTEDILN